MTKTKPRVRVQAPSITMDGFANFITGIGAGNSKTAAATYVLNTSQDDVEAAYRTSTWFGKIVDIPPDDATREWRMWKATKEQIEDLEKTEGKLGVRGKVRQALIFARLYGGAVIVPIGLPGKLDETLKVESIRKGDIKALTVLSRYEITAQGLISDPMNPLYGQPEYYTINSASGMTRIHPSRVIRINGRVVNERNMAMNGWGDSIWMHLRDSITAADGAAAVIDALLQEAKVDVISIPNLNAGMATDEFEQIMLKRWQMVEALKAISNIILIDGADKWEQKQITFAGLPDVTTTLLNIMAGSSDIPMSRLTGKQGSGLSGEDKGSLLNYYDSVKANQELKISPALAPFDEMLIRTALGERDDAIWYEWRPLFQLSEKEKAEIDKLEADATAVYVNTALIPTEAMAKAVQNRMIESGRWPGIEDYDSDDDGFGEDDGSGTLLSKDSRPMSLYVHRKVVNSKDITEWAKSQGFKSVLNDLHVTIIHTRTPMDWIKVGEPESWSQNSKGGMTVNAGGPRLMERFGEATVLQFASSQLAWRHEDIKRLGAETDYPEYQPHITISWDANDIDISKVEPYRGEIILGEEVFSEVKDDWKSSVTEDSK